MSTYLQEVSVLPSVELPGRFVHFVHGLSIDVGGLVYCLVPRDRGPRARLPVHRSAPIHRAIKGLAHWKKVTVKKPLQTKLTVYSFLETVDM